MANYHLKVKAISRKNGRSCVSALAYRSATHLVDLRTGQVYDYTDRDNFIYVEILHPENDGFWINDVSKECVSDRQSTLQKFSDVIEAAEKRNDARVYREMEFSLPCELTAEQNMVWVREFVRDTCVSRGMVAVLNFHFDIDPKTGQEKPHCHVLLSTRELTKTGFSSHKQREWDRVELLEEWREQCAAYQNAALKEHGFEERVSHLSYADQGLDVDPQPKRGKSIGEMSGRGIESDKQKLFDTVRLKNQFRIVKNPELVFSIVTSKHSTFTRKDLAKVLNRYIDDANQFRSLYGRLMASPELVNLESFTIHSGMEEPVYTTRDMLRLELNLVRQAEGLSAQKTHPVKAGAIDKVIGNYNKKLKGYGGLSTDQQGAIRHMLGSSQLSCVVGFAGAGKTTCLEAVREAWEAEGYKVLGLAPTGKAARNIEECGIRAMTIHKFLLSQVKGREQISEKTIVVLDEAGMVDSRRFSELLTLIDKTGAKLVSMGDGSQLQSVEAGPAFRLLLGRVQPAVLEKVVRQQVDWQRDASQLFGTQQARKALELYQENGCIKTVQEDLSTLYNSKPLLDRFCLARQMSGHIWNEMMEDFKAESGKDGKFNPETDFETLSQHEDFGLFKEWKNRRQDFVKQIIVDYGNQRDILQDRGVDMKTLDNLVNLCRAGKINIKSEAFEKVETILRQMSYEHIADTREKTREVMVSAWAKDRQNLPDQSHIMLAFTNKDANKLNEAARIHMREQGNITGKDYTFKAQRVEEDDFGREKITTQDRTFAKGDRLLFTRNNNSLDVKNGTLGTIQQLHKHKITVKLDGVGDKENETLSFSPNLYPFIDNGWATTIHKAQGVTVDHVKLLASYEQYRNLSYVGMSRHRHTLQVFASSLDFWRPEKIIDRLSRVQEKLSGFDYLDEVRIQDVLKEDTKVLWPSQKLNQVKDFWSAIKVTAKDAFHKAFDIPQANKEDTGIKEKYLSFEDSEEMRSKDFFMDSKKPKGKDGGRAKSAKLDTPSSHPPAPGTHKQPETAQPSMPDHASEKKAEEARQKQLALKRKEFESERLPRNQEWCSRMGFDMKHRRLPKPHEIGDAYWQAERLTAIEGRLYQEALAKLSPNTRKTFADNAFVQEARKELEKRQAAPEFIMVWGKASDLTQTQIKQFEQHVLFHQDKTGAHPHPSELEAICKAIKSHKEIQATIKYAAPPSPDAQNYRNLIEQQAILDHHNRKEGPLNQEDIASNKDGHKPISPLRMKMACSDRLQEATERIEKVRAFDAEMAALDLRRSLEKDRGMDCGM